MSPIIDRPGSLPSDVAAPERARSRRREHREGDGAMAASFAGILAGAVTPGRRQPVPAESGAAADERAGAGARVKSGGAAHVERSLSRLAPEFRGPLERVIQRMESEFGHEVTVVETIRDQGRQDALFAQGRTAPGSVVTWTRSSRHSSGMAADLMIDGEYGNAKAYDLLARIAREEGLRTLGPADPGHVELQGGRAGAGVRASEVRGDDGPNGAGQLARLASVARVAQVAQVAQVARVAQVAQIAQVARVARPVQAAMAAADAAGAAGIAVTARTEGSAAERDEVAGALPNAGTGSSEREKTSLSTKRSSIAGSGDVAGADSIGGRAASTSTRGSDTASLDSERDRRPDDVVKSDEYTTRRLDAIALDAGSPVAHSEGAHRPVAAPGGVDMAHRIASLLQLQANAAARPMSHVVLRLDAADGGPEMIRIGIRDRAVDAMLALRDPVAAGHLEAQIGDLQQALGRHGLTGDALKVELLGPRTLEAVWFGAQASIPAGTSVMTEQRGGGQEPPTSHTPPRDHRGGDDGQGSSRRRQDSSNREM